MTRTGHTIVFEIIELGAHHRCGGVVSLFTHELGGTRICGLCNRRGIDVSLKSEVPTATAEGRFDTLPDLTAVSVGIPLLS